VSRPSVREALIALEVEGWVEVRTGSGIYVQAARSAMAHPAPRTATARRRLGPAGSDAARELVEAKWRRWPRARAQAADRRDGRALAHMREERGRRRAARRRRSLPHAIAQACGNEVLGDTVRSYWSARHGPLFVAPGRLLREPRLLERRAAGTRRGARGDPRPRPAGAAPRCSST
jgi:DNA-binding FadR family transcriptional regulator